MKKKHSICIGFLIISIIFLGMFFYLNKKNNEIKSPSADKSAHNTMTVNVVQPSIQEWILTASVNGPIQAWQEMIISPETSGLRIVDLKVDVGTFIKKGQLLAYLADDSIKADLRKQEALVAQARINLAQANSNFKRAQDIGDSGALSGQKIEEYKLDVASNKATLASTLADLDNIKLKLSQTRILAPDSGLVISKTGILGNVVTTGSELYRVVRQGKLEWYPEVDAKQLKEIKIGQLVKLTLPNGQLLDGKVRLIGPSISTNTGRSIVYVSLNNKEGKAHTGMFASGKIYIGTTTALVVPQSAIVMKDGRSYVYLVDASNKVSSKVVDIGRRKDNLVELISLLPLNSRVVVSGGAFLAEGITVKVAPFTGDCL